MKKIKFSQIIDVLKQNDIEFNSEIPTSEIFHSIKTLSNATNQDLSFFTNLKYLKNLKENKSKACIIESKYIQYLPKTCKPIIVNDSYLVLAILTNIFNDGKIISNGVISNKSVVSNNSILHNNIQINPFSIIEDKTEIYENVYLGSNSFIGPNVVIHKNVIIHDNVSISNAIIKENCEIMSGARIGGSGFGFEEKSKQKIFHSGNVIIEKNTTIGSNTTIARAVFDSTVIGKSSNIDNLVQIAHNVIIGDFAIIAAQVGIAGSTKIGNYVKIGGQAGIAGHLTIGNNVTIAAKSGVTKNLQNDKIVAGFPAKDIRLWKKEIIRNNFKK